MAITFQSSFCMALYKQLHFEALLHKEKNDIHILMLKCTSKWKPIWLTLEGGPLVYLQQGYRFIRIRNYGILRHTKLWINWFTFGQTVVAEDKEIQRETERQGIETLSKEVRKGGGLKSPYYLSFPCHFTSTVSAPKTHSFIRSI